jgi:hypothetical protein
MLGGIMIKSFTAGVLAASAFAAPVSATSFTVSGDVTNGYAYQRVQENAEEQPYQLCSSYYCEAGSRYDQYSFVADQDGVHSFVVTLPLTGEAANNGSTWDAFLTLYAGSFDPANALTNVLIADDGDGEHYWPTFDYALDDGETYIAVIAGYDARDYGAYTLSVAPLQAGVPEPASWAMMLAGFGAVGTAMRAGRQRTRVRFG